MSRRGSGAGAWVLAATWIAAAACTQDSSPQSSSEIEAEVDAATPLTREACLHRDPLKQAFFGDLHVHTAYSMDAYISGTRADPDDAYRFARGQQIDVDGRGQSWSRVRIDRPLDFAAVTDHVESMGPVALCTRPESPVYDTTSCQTYRSGGMRGGSLLEMVQQITRRTEALDAEEVCGPDRERCDASLADPWRDTQEAAERWYDRSQACAFTSFVAYEYTFTPELTKIHRNVIFRNEVALDLPIGSDEEPDVRVLWQRLRDECIEAGTGCDVLAIPHNPNLSNGQMFAVEHDPADTPQAQAELAALRASLEPLLEMTQIKGDSECKEGLWNVLGDTDEHCAYEKLRDPQQPEDCGEGTGAGALIAQGCRSRLDFARYALLEGLREQRRIGVNPYKLGLMGSTDSHDATPGDVAEWLHDGVRRRFRGDLRRNPGGLIAVWAEENSREALFDAMRRRETYATSGPRIGLRLFAGWNWPEDLCTDPEWVERGQRGGVPMGGDLSPAPEPTAAPQIAVAALQDAGTPERPGSGLQRLQIIKGWVDDEGRFHQRVFEVDEAPDGSADADPAGGCPTPAPGAQRLCGVWTDPEFDPDRAAVYYARALEQPTCRWSVALCNPPDRSPRPAACDAPDLPTRIQERAWSSPVWYTPAAESD